MAHDYVIGLAIDLKVKLGLPVGWEPTPLLDTRLEEHKRLLLQSIKKGYHVRP